MFIVVPAYYMLESPEKLKKNLANDLLSAGNLADEIQRISQRKSKVEERDTRIRKKNAIVYLLSFMFFIYIGEEVAFGGWISSYSVLNGVTTKQGATMFSSLFWGFMTIFRFLFAFVKEKASKKLKILILGQIGLTVMVLILT